MRVAANLTMLYTEVPLLMRYERAAADGFKLVEITYPYQERPEALKAEADRHGIEHIMINAFPGNWAGGQRGIAALASEQSGYSRSIDQSILYAKMLDCKKVHVMAGVPKSDDDIAAAYKTYIDNIEYAAKALGENNMECLIEPINPITIPGYHLRSYEQAMAVLQILSVPNLSIQFDFFHAAQMPGGIPPNIHQWKRNIGHIQVAQAPGRGEPDTDGSIDYVKWIEWCKTSGQQWVIGCEYTPTKKGADAVAWIRKSGLDF